VICIDPFHGCPAGHRRPGRGAPLGVERTTSATRPGRGQEVQGRPLGAAQTAREPHRRPVRDPAKTAPPRRDVWRAYTLKETFHAIFAGDLDTDDTGALLDRWCSKATRSRLPPFVRVSKTIRKHREGILAAIELGVNNARAEGLNNHVRLITRRAYGFHSAHAALALVMLSCGPITLRLPHEPHPG